MSSKPKTRPERRHNLDKHADQIADQHSAADDDELLDTLATASWLGVSTQFLEIGRVEGYGPPSSASRAAASSTCAATCARG